jgi:glycosyltransferase involved in cell wall biosynthesis
MFGVCVRLDDARKTRSAARSRAASVGTVPHIRDGRTVSSEQIHPGQHGPMHVVMALTYYAPYVSGLTDAARLVAEELVARGHRVQVIATRHDRSLPSAETINGVEVIRAPVLLRVGKGAVSPSFARRVAGAAKTASVVNLHLPMLEAGLVARLCRATPIVVTYQCDVASGGSLLEGVQQRVIDLASRTAMARAYAVAVSSDDYGKHSRLATALEAKSVSIAPPALDRSGGNPTYRGGAGFHVGFLGRIVQEKGLEYLVDGFLAMAEPEDRLLIAGDYEKVAGGSVIDNVRAHAMGDDRVQLLGFLPDSALADFYASLDVFALPSVNSYEAFGIVQVEAMLAGVPALASDLPGVRVPVQRTKFGVVVSRKDAMAIERGLRALKDNRLDRDRGRYATHEMYGVRTSGDLYEELFRQATVPSAAE